MAVTSMTRLGKLQQQREARAKERAKKDAARAEAKESKEFKKVALDARIVDARFEGTCEGTYILVLDSGITLMFSSTGDDATFTSLTVIDPAGGK